MPPFIVNITWFFVFRVLLRLRRPRELFLRPPACGRSEFTARLAVNPTVDFTAGTYGRRNAESLYKGARFRDAFGHNFHKLGVPHRDSSSKRHRDTDVSSLLSERAHGEVDAGGVRLRPPGFREAVGELVLKAALHDQNVAVVEGKGEYLRALVVLIHRKVAGRRRVVQHREREDRLSLDQARLIVSVRRDAHTSVFVEIHVHSVVEGRLVGHGPRLLEGAADERGPLVNRSVEVLVELAKLVLSRTGKSKGALLPVQERARVSRIWGGLDSRSHELQEFGDFFRSRLEGAGVQV